jgi:hypothetical protein|tara:strand:- start:361 stop:645 length:285 start_codon:yes stop_codon:yes gene_type:complete
MDTEGLEVSYKGVAMTPEDVTGDSINPSHYKQGKIEVIDFIIDQKMDYLTSNITKYICRWRFKGEGIRDLKKARWYLNKLIEQQEEGGSAPNPK